MSKNKKVLQAIEKRQSNQVSIIPNGTLIDLDDQIKEETSKIISSAIVESDLDKKKQLYKAFETNVGILKSIKCHDLEDKLLNNLVDRLTKYPDEVSTKDLMDAINLTRSLIDKNNNMVNRVDAIPVNLTQNNTEVTVNVGPSRDSRERIGSIVNSFIKQLNSQVKV